MKRGFTLLELMVASLLLAMLVTTLAMIFNQSSIAWRTGVAGVAELGDARCSLGTFREVCDEILPGIGDRNPSTGAGDNRNLNYRTVPVFQDGADGLRTRTYEQVTWDKAPSITIGDARTGVGKSVQGAGSGQGSSLFTVGVRSAGPDRKFNTNDDITTWPENVD